MVSYSELYSRNFVRDPYSIFLGEKSLSLMKATQNLEEFKDRILAQEIYGDDQNYGNFRQLKSRFQKRILDELYFHTIEKFKSANRNEALVLMLKKYTTALVLKHTNLTETFRKIIESLLKEALHYDNCYLICMISTDLYLFYSFIAPDQNKLEFYRELKAKADRDYNFFSETMLINGEISNIYIRQKLNPTKVQLQRINYLCGILKANQEETKNYDVHVFGYDLRAFPLLVEKRYDELLTLMNEAEAYFKTAPFPDKSMDWSIQFHRLIAFLFLGELDKAIRACEHMLSWLTKGNRYWILVHHYYFITNSVLGNYQKCVDIVETLFASKALNTYPNEKPIWELRMAYFSINKDVLDIKINAISSVKFITSSQFFRRNKELLKDKRAMNLPFRIIEIFYLIERNDFNRVIDIIDSLSQFKYRYLRDDDTFRSQCFIRLLEVMSKCSFHPVRTKAHAGPLLKKMAKKDVIIENENIFPEILPFEQIWNLLMIKISK